VAVTEVFAGAAVAEYLPAVWWYERLLGRPPDFDVIPGAARRMTVTDPDGNTITFGEPRS
jgi:hypothetical protein